jgi:protein transport protein SEC24
MWLGRDAVPALIADVFGTEDKNMLKQGKTSIPVIDSEMNERVRAVVEKSRDHRGKGCGSIVVPPLYLIREDGEPSLRLWAQTLLIEDRADQGVSGAQFIGMLREKVIS